MYETLLEIHKSLDKEDEILWPHLMYGLFYSAAKITLVLITLTSISIIGTAACRFNVFNNFTNLM